MTVASLGLGAVCSICSRHGDSILHSAHSTEDHQRDINTSDDQMQDPYVQGLDYYVSGIQNPRCQKCFAGYIAAKSNKKKEVPHLKLPPLLPLQYAPQYVCVGIEWQVNLSGQGAGC
jgi:hypothetical protein